MPKVIHVVRKFEPLEWGGIETHLLGLIPGLQRLGWSSEVHAPREAGTDGSTLIAAGAGFRTFAAHYPVLGMRASDRAQYVASGGNLVSPHELVRLLRERRASMLHVHTVRRLGGVVRVASRLKAVPYAVTLHSPIRAGTGAMPGPAGHGRRLIDLGAPFGLLVGARRVVHDADVVFTVNQSEMDAWAPDRVGKHLEKLSLGVDSERATSAARAQARALVPGLGQAPFVVMIARLDPIKGHDTAIAAFAQAAPTTMHLVMAGSEVDPPYTDELRDRARVLGSRAHFLGNVAPHLARALLAESHLVLIPSRAEAFGLTLPEAWAEGACALFANIGGLHDSGDVARAQFGRVDDNTVEGWSRRMSETLADAAGMERERVAGPQRVADHFAWRTVAERVAGAYRRATLGSWPA
ncbi:MAG: glycosyltransferase family 4 protein [Planctomycetes bacterium]|nr:glycosyltransferase family 4 protein [Planctomycetota bacterium]